MPELRPAIAWMLLAALAASPAAGATLDLTISGIPADLEVSARAQLAISAYVGREVSEPQVKRLMGSGDAQIRTALEAYGYYEARVEQRLENEPGKFHVYFNVTLGPPVLVTISHVQMAGEAQTLPAVEAALANFVPRVGDRLDHGLYETSKAKVQSALSDNGFLKAELLKHRVEVVSRERTAGIDLAWQSGPRYRFGAVHFSETQFKPEFLQRFLPWQDNDFYSASKLLELQQRLANGDYFGSVLVQPRIEQAADLTVPVDVALSPAKRNVYSGSLYASTDTGVGVKLGWQRRWLNASGHKLTTDLDVAQRLQAASTSYIIPLPGTSDWRLNFGLTYRDETTDTSVSRTFKFVANETRKWRELTAIYGLQLVSGDFDIGDFTHGNSTLLYAEASLTRTHADDPTFPRSGYNWTAAVRAGPEIGGASTRFAAIGGRAKWLRALTPNTRLILRANLAGMTVDDFDRLPPELRFFAGGDRSIRGFDYQALGSRNEAGDVLGGEYLAVASAEWEYYFRKDWGIATFVDGGDAFFKDTFTLNVGAGIGARWKSPVGVVRLDIGVPVKTELDNKDLRFHLVIGPDL